MYVAVKGGEAAIRNAHRLLADRRRGIGYAAEDAKLCLGYSAKHAARRRDERSRLYVGEFARGGGATH